MTSKKGKVMTIEISKKVKKQAMNQEKERRKMALPPLSFSHVVQTKR
jgi:hypothetical protein